MLVECEWCGKQQFCLDVYNVMDLVFLYILVVFSIQIWFIPYDYWLFTYWIMVLVLVMKNIASWEVDLYWYIIICTRSVYLLLVFCIIFLLILIVVAVFSVRISYDIDASLCSQYRVLIMSYWIDFRCNWWRDARWE